MELLLFLLAFPDEAHVSVQGSSHMNVESIPFVFHSESKTGTITPCTRDFV